MSHINNKTSILITGGTGSFGNAFVSNILENFPNIERLVIFSRDEFKQDQMKHKFPMSKYPGIRFYIGDIRDKERLTRALSGIDIVIHAAAMKQIDAAEQNPFECIKTNVIGTQNLVDSCIDNGISKLICISTDKATSPSNLYGASKLCSERLILSATNYKGNNKLISCIVRYGNVFGSRGSVVPAFIEQIKKGKIYITEPEMTRFNIILSDGVELVKWSIDNMKGNEIFVPKLSSYNIMDLAEALAPTLDKEFIGKRQGEKLHEIMITKDESLHTIDLGELYVILPTHFKNQVKEYCNKTKGKIIQKAFEYSSETNNNFLDVIEIKSLLKKEKYIN